VLYFLRLMENEENTQRNPLRFLVGLAILVVVLVSVFGGALADRIFGLRPLDRFFPRSSETTSVQRQVLAEESVTIEIAKNVSPAVVTIAVEEPKRRILEFDPFEGFKSQEQGGQQDIATGFIVDSGGLLVTNKHVVSGGGNYKVITKDGNEYEVKKIYRDPANDLAILKIDPSAGSGQVLPVVKLGDSDSLQVGQYVAAIGTALGEFRHSVTTGVISGIGRSIDAGSANPFEGFAERLDNVIQTDAAINPGNSGGPLLNSLGEVVGVNVAVAVGADNVGFALPVNLLRDSIDQFHKTGDFTRPFLGVQYQMITRDAALRNEIPEGAYVREVVSNSSAAGAGIKVGDIITRFGGEKLQADNGGLAVLVNKYKVGDSVPVEIWRNEETVKLQVILAEAS